MRKIPLEEFLAELKAQGVPWRHVAFKCVVCGTVQSMGSLILAGAGKTEDDAEKYLAFSCVGRWTNAGPHKQGTPPGRGCDWTLGGLFRLHTLEVVTPDGKSHPRFEPATPAEAMALKHDVQGMVWWNSLSKLERQDALNAAGARSSVADAYALHLVNQTKELAHA